MGRRRFLSFAATAPLLSATGAVANARRIAVADFAELSMALAEARPGDEVVLADGEYHGDRLVVAGHGTAQNPIIIRAASLLGANIPNGVRLSGQYIVWHGFDMTNVEGAQPMVELGGSHNQVRRCRLRARGDLVVFLSGTAGKFLYNELVNPTPTDHFQPNTHLLRGWFNDHTRHYNAEIGYNHIHDFPSKPPNVPYHEYRRFGIAAGSLYHYMFENVNWYIHHNLMENCGSHRMIAYSSGNRFEFNTIIGRSVADSAASSDFNQRLGRHNIWRGNWAEGTKSGFSIHGGPNEFIGCRIVDGGNANVFAGNQEHDALGEGQPRAHEVKLTACEMPLIVGRQWSGHTLPARNTRLENHLGEVHLDDSGQIGTVLTADMTEVPVTPLRLTRDMVGPFAAS